MPRANLQNTVSVQNANLGRTAELAKFETINGISLPRLLLCSFQVYFVIRTLLYQKKIQIMAKKTALG